LALAGFTSFLFFAGGGWGVLGQLPRFAVVSSVAVLSVTAAVRARHASTRPRGAWAWVATPAGNHVLLYCPAATETQPAHSSPPPSNVPQPLPDIDGLTEEQFRARCATVFAPARDPRLPPPGAVLTVLTRIWEGTEHQALILDRGFEYQGQTYTSLTAIARTISKVSGFQEPRFSPPHKLQAFHVALGRHVRKLGAHRPRGGLVPLRGALPKCSTPIASRRPASLA